MLNVALTGGIACGKSLAGSILAEDAVPVCDTDDVARQLMQPGGPVHKSVAAAFGREILTVSGDIDRDALAKVIFDNPTRREELNRLVHPAVWAAVRDWLDSLPAACPLAVVIVPLLFETGSAGDWDAVVCIAASESVQRDRLTRLRGMSPEDAEARIRAQWPVAEKAARADYVVRNEATIDEFTREFRQVMQEILESTHGR